MLILVEAMNGIFLLDKRAGMSSAAVVGILKRRFGGLKLGHAGTLDPFASGLLVLLSGRATRLAAHAVSGRKVYTAEICFGVETDTDDITGTPIGGASTTPSLSEIEGVLDNFKGVIHQEPPQFSAKKVDGRRAYKVARSGRTVQLDSAQVTVDALDFWSVPKYDDGCNPEQLRFFFKIVCSKGTYIRSIARDIGRALGCGAHLLSLRREESFPFSVGQAVSLEECSAGCLIGWDRLFPNFYKISLEEEKLQQLELGREVIVRQVVDQLSAEASFDYDKAIVTGPDGQPHTFFQRNLSGDSVRKGSEWSFIVSAPVGL